MSGWAWKASWHYHKHDDSHNIWNLAAQGSLAVFSFSPSLATRVQWTLNGKFKMTKFSRQRKKILSKQKSWQRHQLKPILLWVSAGSFCSWPRVCLFSWSVRSALFCSLTLVTVQWRESYLICVRGRITEKIKNVLFKIFSLIFCYCNK